MKRNPKYTLIHLAGADFLFPYGQMIADHSRSVQLNKTGTAIWKLLKNPIELPTLTALVAQELEPSPEELPALQRDVKEFTQKLMELNILINTPAQKETAACYLRIAGLTIKLCGDAKAFSENFNLFKLPATEEKMAEASTDQTILITEEEPPHRENNWYLLKNPQLCICETADSYILQFPASTGLKEGHLQKDGSRTVFYCQAPYHEELIYDLFHAIRISFLFLAQKHHMYALHSASIRYQGKAWLFSGPSGTGKSTHTNLWKQYISTPVINGDLNLLALQDKKPVIHGIPWCGTSEICDSHTWPLGGITLLKQEPDNRLLPIEDSQLQLAVLQRLISPLWTEAMLLQAADFVQQLSPLIFLGKLGCTISPKAVHTIKEKIDEWCLAKNQHKLI